MDYINGGAKLVTGSFGNIATKKRLKELIRDSPELVKFYPTSYMGPQFSGTLDKFQGGGTLIVVGPDPALDRRWYANITRTQKGLRVT